MCCNEKIKHSFKSMNSNSDNCTSSFHIRKQKISQSHIGINYHDLFYCIPNAYFTKWILRIMLYSCRYYLYQLFFPFKNLCGRVFSTHSFMATRHNLKKKSARLNNRNVWFEYSRQPLVSRTMYSEWNVILMWHSKNEFVSRFCCGILRRINDISR